MQLHRSVKPANKLPANETDTRTHKYHAADDILSGV
jgi:hypothetical protein